MTRSLLAMLTLIACGPVRDRADMPCNPIVGDWIEVPGEVQIEAMPAGSALIDVLEVEGHGVICELRCEPAEHVGLLLHPDSVDDNEMKRGDWSPADDLAGKAVPLPATLGVYSTDSEPGMTSTCEVYSTAGVDVVEVVVIE